MIKTYFVLMLLLGAGFLGVRSALVNPVRKFFDARMYLSVAIILADGFMVHDALLFMLVASAALLITASSRTDAICRLVVLVALIPNVDQYIILGGMTITVTGMPAVLSLAALIACYARKGLPRRGKWTAEDALVVLLVLCFGVAAQRHANFISIQRTAFTVVLLLGLSYFVYHRFLQSTAEFAQLIAALAGAAMILAFIAVCEAKMHWAIYDAVYINQASVARMAMNLKVRGGLLRAPASFSDSTALAIFEVVGIFAVIASRRFFRSGLLWSGSIAVTVLGLLAAQSRGADLGLLSGLFFMMVIRRRYAAAAGAAIGAASLVILALTLASSSPKIASFIGADKTAGADQDYRQTLLRRGMEVGMEHPILGNDMPLVVAEMSDITQGEGLVDLVNTYLTIFLVSGLLGLGIFIVLLTTIFAKLFGAGGKKGDESFIGVHLFVAGAMTGGWVTLAFTSFVYERNAYWMMMLLACCRGLADEVRGSPAAVTPEPGEAAAVPALGPVHRWHDKPVLEPV